MPISGIGGIATWRDAAEFMALGAGTVQVCTAAMHYGFKIVDDMIDGLCATGWTRRAIAGLDELVGRAVPNVTDWQYSNLNYKIIARIDQELCIKCGLCHIACEDTSHQAIAALKNDGKRRYEVIDAECVGCNLCMHVCPVPGCITMVEVGYRQALPELDPASGQPDAQGGRIKSWTAREGPTFLDENGERRQDDHQHPHQRRAAVGQPDGAGADRRDREGRRLPPGADRPRPPGARPVRRWCEEAGCTVTVDKMGNIFARRPGQRQFACRPS